MRARVSYGARIVVLLCAALFTAGETSAVPKKAEIYVLGRFPSGPEAKDHSGEGFGLGGCIVFPSHRVAKLFAAVGGVDWVELKSKTRGLD